MMWAHLMFVFIGSTAAQVLKLGACPAVVVKPDFAAAPFLGKWYEAERYSNIYELGGKCNTVTFSANANGSINVLNEHINYLTGTPTSIRGYASQNQAVKSKMSIVFTSLPLQRPTPYWVIETDYTTYAVIWSCTDVTLFSARFAWILTRAQNPAPAVLAAAYAVFDANNISRSPLQVTDQTNCP